MTWIPSTLVDRLSELGWSIDSIDGANVTSAPVEKSDRWEVVSTRRTIALTSSRLGKDLALRGGVCDRLRRLMFDADPLRSIFLIAHGSAIEPWAIRACDLFQATGIVLDFGTDRTIKRDVVLPDHARVCRVRLTRRRDCTIASDDVDRALIQCADYVEALHVRRNGNIYRAILERLRDQDNASVRVAVGGRSDGVASELIAAGAIGRWAGVAVPIKTGVVDLANDPHVNRPAPNNASPVDPTDSSWFSDPDNWLIHCTRVSIDGWPGQTFRCATDEWLLSRVGARDSIDTLFRILCQQRLAGSATASAKAFPVVCFAAMSLLDSLARRCYRPHLRRWDYEPVGIAIRRSRAIELGAVPVVYGDHQLRDSLPNDQRFRYQARGNTFDWTVEQEYRYSGSIDLSKFGPEELRIFVPCQNDVNRLPKQCPWPVTVVDSILKQTNPSQIANLSIANSSQ